MVIINGGNYGLRKIDPDEHEKVFSLFPGIQNSFNELDSVISSNGESAPAKKLVKSFLVYYYPLVFIMLIELVITVAMVVILAI